MEDYNLEDILGAVETAQGESYTEPGYEGKIDPRIRQLSYSSLLTLHECPRKFQLQRLRSQKASEEDLKTKVTFAFGHAFGEGVQLILQNKSLDEVFLALFFKWEPELFALDDKACKSFFYALDAVEKFYHLREELLGGWELLYYNGKPSCELSARIQLPEGFKYRLFIDAVLKNPETGQIKVLETKTTGAVYLHPAMYQNSSQGVGYSVVIDKLAGEMSDYEVLYLPYQTKAGKFQPMPFQKTRVKRALWLQELVLDVETIQMYEAAGIYPTRGESCFSYNRPCPYIDTCHLSTEFQMKPCREQDLDQNEYDIETNLLELIDAQQELNGA